MKVPIPRVVLTSLKLSANANLSIHDVPLEGSGIHATRKNSRTGSTDVTHLDTVVTSSASDPPSPSSSRQLINSRPPSSSKRLAPSDRPMVCPMCREELLGKNLKKHTRRKHPDIPRPVKSKEVRSNI